VRDVLVKFTGIVMLSTEASYINCCLLKVCVSSKLISYYVFQGGKLRLRITS